MAQKTIRTWSAQKAGLTRAINSHDYGKVVAECKRVIGEWEGLPHGWPDDWHRWNIALSDGWDHERNRYVTGHIVEMPAFQDMADLRVDLIRSGVI